MIALALVCVCLLVFLINCFTTRYTQIESVQLNEFSTKWTQGCSLSTDEASLVLATGEPVPAPPLGRSSGDQSIVLAPVQTHGRWCISGEAGVGAAQRVHPRGLDGSPPPGLCLFCLARE